MWGKFHFHLKGQERGCGWRGGGDWMEEFEETKRKEVIDQLQGVKVFVREIFSPKALFEGIISPDFSITSFILIVQKSYKVFFDNSISHKV